MLLTIVLIEVAALNASTTVLLITSPTFNEEVSETIILLVPAALLTKSKDMPIAETGGLLIVNVVELTTLITVCRELNPSPIIPMPATMPVVLATLSVTPRLPGIVAVVTTPLEETVIDAVATGLVLLILYLN